MCVWVCVCVCVCTPASARNKMEWVGFMEFGEE